MCLILIIIRPKMCLEGVMCLVLEIIRPKKCLEVAMCLFSETSSLESRIEGAKD